MTLPVCCGIEMEINAGLDSFIETVCRRCGDVVYIKKIKIGGKLSH